jgi:hypothetical protein
MGARVMRREQVTEARALEAHEAPSIPRFCATNEEVLCFDELQLDTLGGVRRPLRALWRGFLTESDLCGVCSRQESIEAGATAAAARSSWTPTAVPRPPGPRTRSAWTGRRR